MLRLTNNDQINFNSPMVCVDEPNEPDAPTINNIGARCIFPAERHLAPQGGKQPTVPIISVREA